MLLEAGLAQGSLGRHRWTASEELVLRLVRLDVQCREHAEEAVGACIAFFIDLVLQAEQVPV